jgi:hypothetical protein
METDPFRRAILHDLLAEEEAKQASHVNIPSRDNFLGIALPTAKGRQARLLATRLLATRTPHNGPRKSKSEQTPGLLVGSMTECDLAIPAARSRKEKKRLYDKRNCEVVQRPKGLRIHPAG